MAIDTDQTLEAPGVLLTGASSQIGIFAIPRLVQAGFRVVAINRKGRPRGFPVFEKVKWLNETEAMQASPGCRYLLSAGPMELAQKFLESGKQIQTVVVFSSSSVETKHESDNVAERNQIQALMAMESQLQRSAENKGFKLVVFRPTLIYGCGLDTNISRLARFIQRFGFIPVNGAAAGLRQPAHADDLASIAVSALLSNDALPPVLSLSGGETLSYSDMVTRIFAAFGKPARLIHLPGWLFALLVRMAGVFRIAGGINPEMVKRQAVNLVLDDREARKLLAYSPRRFAPTEKDFSLPDF